MYRIRGKNSSKYFDRLVLVELDALSPQKIKESNPLTDVGGNVLESAALIECEAGQNTLSHDGRYLLITTDAKLNKTAPKQFPQWKNVWIRDLVDERTISVSETPARLKDEMNHDCHSAGMSRNGLHIGYFCTYLGSSQDLYWAHLNPQNHSATVELVHSRNPLLGTEDLNVGVNSITNDGVSMIFSTGVHLAAGAAPLAPGLKDSRHVHTYLYDSRTKNFTAILAHYANKISKEPVLLPSPSRPAAMSGNGEVFVIVSDAYLLSTKKISNNTEFISAPFLIDTASSSMALIGESDRKFEDPLLNERGTKYFIQFTTRYSSYFRVSQPPCRLRMTLSRSVRLRSLLQSFQRTEKLLHLVRNLRSYLETMENMVCSHSSLMRQQEASMRFR